MKALRSFSLFLAGFLALAATADAQNLPSPPATTFLSDLTWVSATNGWGPVEKDRSNGETAAGDGRPLKIRGTTYAKGLGVVPTSRITYDLGGQYTTFLVDVGVDDEVNGLGSVVFQVWVDGVKHYDSAVLTGASPPKSVRVDVTGKMTLHLVVTEGGDNIFYDHANWADARLLATAFPLPSGPLSVHPHNPRYFTDGSSSNAIYLTGSHTWNSVQDRSDLALPGGTFAGFLDWLVARGHNFLRLWMMEHSGGQLPTATPTVSPLPWLRTGPGTALDGKPKFDLTHFDPAYFDRLRQRAIEAGSRGFYVSIMFFDNWSTDLHENWQGHPFHPGNNVNGVDGDRNGDGRGLEFHTLQVPTILALQDEYVKKVVDTVNDLDHVMYEVANETGNVGALAWQTRVVDLIREYQASKPKQHLVGMTVGSGEINEVRNEALFNSNVDWISPGSVDTDDFDYRENPRPNDGRKVILSDTDHYWGIGGDRGWVWKSFLRGLHPIFMDPLDGDATRESARLAMGDTLVYAKKMNLVAMAPRTDFASTRYSLVNPEGEYLVYQPDTGAFRVRLPVGVYSVEWFNPSTRVTLPASTITVASTDTLSFVPPFAGDAVLYLKLRVGG